jgi:hypothetical protein
LLALFLCCLFRLRFLFGVDEQEEAVEGDMRSELCEAKISSRRPRKRIFRPPAADLVRDFPLIPHNSALAIITSTPQPSHKDLAALIASARIHEGERNKYQRLSSARSHTSAQLSHHWKVTLVFGAFFSFFRSADSRKTGAVGKFSSSKVVVFGS